MATLLGLLRSVFPGAVALGPALSGGGPVVAWVRIMHARVPAFDALEAGDLVIVPEGAFATIVHEPGDAEQVADELARTGVSAVVLLPQPAGVASGGWAGAAAALVAGLAARGVSTFRSGATDEATLERSVIGYLVNERAELDRQVGRVEADLQAIALRGGGLPEMAAAISGFLGRAVAIEDGEGAIVAVHAPPDSPAGATAAARYQGQRRGPPALRHELPGGGALVLLGELPLSELEQLTAERLGMLLALEFTHESAMRRGQGRAGEAMPAGGPPWVALMARQVLPGEVASGAEREERRKRVRRLAPAHRLLLRGDAASIELRAVVAAGPDDPQGLELAGRVARLLGRPVAVSRPFREASARPAADAEARALLEAADELAALRPPPEVLRADRLAMYRLLGSLHNLPDGERHARSLLAPVLRGPVPTQERNLATLRAALDSAGPAEAAAKLGVHRNTVAYRLHAFEAQSGWDLGDAELRLALALALRLVPKPQT